MATKNSIDKSIKNGYSASVKSKGFNVADVVDFTVSVGGDYTVANSDPHSETISKAQSLDIKASGNGDGVDHDQDLFILLLNPAVAFSYCSPTKSVNWYMGLNTTLGGPSLVYYEVPVSYLKNPALMPPNVSQPFQALNFTISDYQTILSLDPFANGSTTITSRFLPTTYTFPYEPPLIQTDCNAGVCSCTSMSDTIKNSFQSDSGHSFEQSWDVSVSVSADFKPPFLGFLGGASAGYKYTNTYNRSDTNMTESSQGATATIQCPSINYSGPTLMQIYWDTLFGSFMFRPWAFGSTPAITLSQGNVTDSLGRPVRHQPVQLSFGAKTYHTYTNNSGDFLFFSLAGLPNQVVGQQYKGSAQLTVGSIKQVVSLGSRQKILIRLPAASPISAKPTVDMQNVVPAAPACCVITAVNSQTGIVSAKVNATSQIFQFKVTNQALLSSLAVGRGVYVNFPTRQVSLDGRTSCCTITALGPRGAPMSR